MSSCIDAENDSGAGFCAGELVVGGGGIGTEGIGAGAGGTLGVGAGVWTDGGVDIGAGVGVAGETGFGGGGISRIRGVISGSGRGGGDGRSGVFATGGTAGVVERIGGGTTFTGIGAETVGARGGVGDGKGAGADGPGAFLITISSMKVTPASGSLDSAPWTFVSSVIVPRSPRRRCESFFGCPLRIRGSDREIIAPLLINLLKNNWNNVADLHGIRN